MPQLYLPACLQHGVGASWRVPRSVDDEAGAVPTLVALPLRLGYPATVILAG